MDAKTYQNELARLRAALSHAVAEAINAGAETPDSLKAGYALPSQVMSPPVTLDDAGAKAAGDAARKWLAQALFDGPSPFNVPQTTTYHAAPFLLLFPAEGRLHHQYPIVVLAPLIDRAVKAECRTKNLRQGRAAHFDMWTSAFPLLRSFIEAGMCESAALVYLADPPGGGAIRRATEGLTQDERLASKPQLVVSFALAAQHLEARAAEWGTLQQQAFDGAPLEEVYCERNVACSTGGRLSWATGMDLVWPLIRTDPPRTLEDVGQVRFAGRLWDAFWRGTPGMCADLAVWREPWPRPRRARFGLHDFALCNEAYERPEVFGTLPESAKGAEDTIRKMEAELEAKARLLARALKQAQEYGD